MDIEQFRVVVRAGDFDRSNKFYGDVLALPLLHGWDGDQGRGALFRAGAGVIELVGRRRAGRNARLDDAFDSKGPDQKLSVTLIVPSAEKAYEELIFRDRNIPGGLKHLPDGTLVFETHDPDGVKILYREGD